VRFLATTFEDYQSPDDVFSLIVSATAFHWIDPEIAWSKTAGLLARDGWLALIDTGERYDEPFAGRLRDLYVRNAEEPWESPSQGDQARRATSTDICERWSGKRAVRPGLFGPAQVTEHSEGRAVAADFVVDLEMTRATPLSYEPAKRDRFVCDLREILEEFPTVELTQITRMVMAQVARV
jgi:hypothetical protein